MHTRFAKSLLVLVVLAFLAVLVLSVSPPRMRSSSIDLKWSVIDPARLTVRINQRIKAVAAPNVSISPTSAYNVSSAGDMIFVDFENPLLAATDYVVNIDDVTSQNTSKKVSKTIRFTTPSYDFAYIRRGIAGTDSNSPGMSSMTKYPDKVILKTLGDSTERVLYEADKIDEIEAIGNMLAVSEVIGENTHRLLLINKKGEVSEITTLPETRISMLRASNDGLLLGFLSIDQSAELSKQTKVLKFYDVRAKIVFSLSEKSGGQNGVYDWAFSPDSSLVSIISSEGSLLVHSIDGSESPSLFGRFDSVSGFSFDGKFLFVAKSGQPKQINISTADIDVISYSDSSEISDNGFVLTPKRASRGFLADSAIYADSPDGYISTVSEITQDNTIKELFRTFIIKEAILVANISPNDQYAFIETSSLREAIYDDYPSVRKPQNVITRVVDISSALEVEQIAGFDLSVFSE